MLQKKIDLFGFWKARQKGICALQLKDWTTVIVEFVERVNSHCYFWLVSFPKSSPLWHLNVTHVIHPKMCISHLPKVSLAITVLTYIAAHTVFRMIDHHQRVGIDMTTIFLIDAILWGALARLRAKVPVTTRDNTLVRGATLFTSCIHDSIKPWPA